MGRFRVYKNGMEAHRYKGLYITRNNASRSTIGKYYDVYDRDGKTMLCERMNSIADCEWFIDKHVANKDEMEAYRMLYACDIPKLHRMCAGYSQKTEEGTITDKEKKLYKIVLKIRDRKTAEKDFGD